jgi:TolB-like protein/tetratricopeptide (TPR) repeat protein
LDRPAPTGAVFLSYASQDAPAAERICEALRAAGIEVWLDKNELRGGDAWDAQIKKRIHECALFVPLISAHTNARSEGYFRREWKQATRRLQDMADDVAFLVPVVIDETREVDARVPEEFLSAQWTWLPGGETPPAFAQRVQQLLGGESTHPHDTRSATASNGRDLVPARRSRMPHQRWFVAASVALLLVGLSGGLWSYYQGATDAPSEIAPASTVPTVSAAALNEKSIAVLPFVDMSAEKNQEYMSDGIAEELLNLLAQVPDLKVIARTSSFAFKGEKIEVSEIAKRLNVAHVLEGSVRTSGNRLRVTAQLVRTADSTHLWSEKYDRPLNDIFAVQDEIANAIVQALQIRLMGGKLTRREGGTQNLEAYQLYLRSSSLQDRTAPSSLDAAGEYAERAIRLDANYGLAWYELANTFAHKADNALLPATEGYERARQLAQHALELSPDLIEAHVRLGYIHRQLDWDWAAADAALQRALAIDPTNSFALRVAGMLSTTLGRWDDAELQFRAALVRDPLDRYAIWNLGNSYYLAGRFAESESTYRKLLELAPDFGWTRPYLGKTLLAQGKPEAALAMVQQEANEGSRLLFLPLVLQAVGRRAEADDALKYLIEKWADTQAFYVAQNYAYRGDHDLALQWLERAYRQKDSGLTEIVGEPLFKGLADDPRFRAFLQKMNLPE